ncbi:hypothetical protein KIPB_007442, partial [Kipferlia bialata]
VKSRRVNLSKRGRGQSQRGDSLPPYLVYTALERRGRDETKTDARSDGKLILTGLSVISPTVISSLAPACLLTHSAPLGEPVFNAAKDRIEVEVDVGYTGCGTAGVSLPLGRHMVKYPSLNPEWLLKQNATTEGLRNKLYAKCLATEIVRGNVLPELAPLWPLLAPDQKGANRKLQKTAATNSMITQLYQLKIQGRSDLIRAISTGDKGQVLGIYLTRLLSKDSYGNPKPSHFIAFKAMWKSVLESIEKM